MNYPKTISFVVLALNEADNIEETVRTITSSAYLSDIDDFELILVNDGSSDQTGILMDGISGASEKIFVVHNTRNLGFGAAYLRGLEKARMEYIMIIAGDNIMPASSIREILNNLGETDMILPFMTDAVFRERIRAIGSWSFARLINLISGTKIRYYNSMVVRRRLFTDTVIESRGYTLQAECVIKFLRKGATYIEIGVPHGFEFVRKTSSHALRPRNLLNLVYSLFKLSKDLTRSIC
jgi:glycosyltransferase involved in cell wall biosynthesis